MYKIMIITWESSYVESIYVLAISMGHPPDVLADVFDIDIPPGLTMVGGIAGFTNLSDARRPDDAIM